MGFLEKLRRRPSAPPFGLLDRELTAHYRHWIGEADRCYPAAINADPRIEIRSIPPSRKLPFRVIHTVGMASKAMLPMKDQEPLAELLMILPADYDLGDEPDWTVRELKRFALMFHEMSSCLSEFIVIPVSPPPGNPFRALMAVRPTFLPPMVHHLELSTGQTVPLWALMPLHYVDVVYQSTQSEPDALWSLARSQHRSALELFLLDPRRPPIA